MAHAPPFVEHMKLSHTIYLLTIEDQPHTRREKNEKIRAFVF